MQDFNNTGLKKLRLSSMTEATNSRNQKSYKENILHPAFMKTLKIEESPTSLAG